MYKYKIGQQTDTSLRNRLPRAGACTKYISQGGVRHKFTIGQQLDVGV